MKYPVFCCIVFSLLVGVSAKVYDSCSLAGELSRRGVPRGEIPAWVCIAQYESTFNTAAVGSYNSDGSRDWGLFQINDRYWCNPQDGRSTTNICGIDCHALTSGDIGAAINCARRIQAIQGWSAWTVWNNQCRGGGALPNIYHCI